jgi:hypothetical protein
MVARLVASWRTTGKPASSAAPQRVAPKHRVDEIEAAVTIARYLDYWKRL